MITSTSTEIPRGSSATPGMATVLTEHRDHEIREAVEHISLVKAWRAIYHAENLHDLADTIKAAERMTHGREEADSDETSGLVPFVERQIRSDLPRHTTPILTRRAMPREVQDVADLLARTKLADAGRGGGRSMPSSLRGRSALTQEGSMSARTLVNLTLPVRGGG